nr:putative F-box protein At5g62660 [Ipomoea trifida]
MAILFQDGNAAGVSALLPSWGLTRFQKVDDSWREIRSTTITGHIDAAVHVYGIIYFIPQITEQESSSKSKDSCHGCCEREGYQVRTVSIWISSGNGGGFYG